MRPFHLLGLAVIACSLGCGYSTARVHGTVKHKGELVTDATIMLLTIDNQVYRADLDGSGSYVIEGVPQGSVRVAIQQALPAVAPRPDPPAFQRDRKTTDSGEVITDDRPPRATSPPGTPRIPENLADAAKSGLSFELNKPDFEWSIDIP